MCVSCSWPLLWKTWDDLAICLFHRSSEGLQTPALFPGHKWGSTSRSLPALPDLSLAAMELGPQTSSSSSIHTPHQAWRTFLSSLHRLLLDHIQARVIISPKGGMERVFQPQTPQPPRSCGSSGPAGKQCWSWDLKVALILVTLAGALILLLLFRLLQLRHRYTHPHPSEPHTWLL